MILSLKDVAKCTRCGSSHTIIEMVIPSRNPKDLRGTSGKEMAEIVCKECGKIDRSEVELKIE